MMARTGRWTPGLANKMSESEIELYEKARDATKEAQRQGDEQLQAAMTAAAAAAPLRMCQTTISIRRLNWFLKFKDPKMEKAYESKCSAGLELLVLLVTACELAVSVFYLWMAFEAFHKTSSISGLSSFQYAATHLFLHLLAFAINASVLIFYLGGSKWYNRHKEGILSFYSYSLWTWESARLFITTNELWFNALEIVLQCSFIGLIPRVPFCSHLRSRLFGFGCQFVSLICRSNIKGSQVLLLSLCIGHMIGLTFNYWLDYQVRISFLKSFPRWMVDDSSLCDNHSASTYRKSYTKKLWKTHYPDLLDKSESTNIASQFASEKGASHRALGGFAGGFGGVSGLKSRKASTAAPLSSSSDSVSGKELSDSSDEFWAGSTVLPKEPSLGLKDPNAMLYGLNQKNEDTSP